ncbi:hypothetical protein HMPREF1514_1011 [Streptococcus sp. AS20]|nr:hypothetical protein HMPREF1514_1011 [Streptococcus sp. AS20]
MKIKENQCGRVFSTLRQVVEAYDDVEVVYPVHLSPAVQEVA